ncbi:hypothetical protein D6D17_02815 [Aureobasidium pullulans]|uniref:Prefoldin beta-like protein n=2 Tax=Aureobasidium pullulans TaxID=5580 RepID=A0A4T0FFB9_AURPU|nr:hypothetical protein D6D21_01184 [Aureobasidium pullulans]THW98131.1 hypothetical protein D6D18_05292 [Aureobasidium pullulans]THX16319.1 hypothetical protein D6D17_02815 [Aureobasidium pullulans]THX17972.1 hypothetical protein D6D13_00339 [Aureobasidium pullulans]THX33324.1 hypothetical protein D6D12_01648 [Aureobasidium pullulans]
MATPEQQKQLQALSDEYTTLQNELQTTVAARQKLESQQQENKGVKSEFANLDDDANIYKLVGPILLKQDATEAKSTVDGRLEFIDKEMSVFVTVLIDAFSLTNRSNRIEKQISDIQAKSEEKKMALQTDIQQTGQA